MSTKDDTTLGAILLQMGVISLEQLDMALEKQDVAREKMASTRLGNILCDMELCPSEILDLAVKTQEGLRSGDKSDRAMAIASMASFRKKAMTAATNRMMATGDKIVRKTVRPGSLKYSDLVAGGFVVAGSK